MSLSLFLDSDSFHRGIHQCSLPWKQSKWGLRLWCKDVCRCLLWTWHGHSSYLALKTSTQEFSQGWSFLQSIIHCPKPMLFSFLQASIFSSFSGEIFSPQTQIGLEQSAQPFGQLTLQGQSIEYYINDFINQINCESFTVHAFSESPSTIHKTICIRTS